MVPPAFTGSGASLLVTERSARPTTAVCAVAELLSGHGSKVSLVAVAVLRSVVPSGVLGSTLTTSLKVAVAPAPNVEIVQLTVPVPPTAGVEQLKAGPLVCANETNVVLAGIASVNATLTAPLGPRLLSAMS